MSFLRRKTVDNRPTQGGGNDAQNQQTTDVKSSKQGYPTRQYVKMTFRMAKLSFLSFWNRHRVASRITAIILALIILFSIFFQFYEPQNITQTYDITGAVGELIDEPIDLYAEKLQLNQETGAFVYNSDYQPAQNKDGDSYAPKIQANFGSSAQGNAVTVTDPVNNVGVTFKPEFRVREPMKKENRVVYPIIGKDALKIYTLKATGVKEDIVLRSAPKSDELTFEYTIELPEGLEMRLELDGSLAVYGVSSALLGNVSTGSDEDAELLEKARANGEKTEYLFRIPAPVVVGRNSKASTAVAEFKLDGDKLTVHASGLSDAEYPLSIDPSVYVETAAKLMRGNNETNTDFDVDNELIQKSQTTGARIDSWQDNLDMDDQTWDHATAAAGGYVYRTGGRTGQIAAVKPVIADQAESFQNSNSSSFTMSLPSSRPAGDLYIALMCHDGTSSVSPPAGWTEYADTREHAAYYKIGTNQGGGNESASYTWTGGNENWAGVIVRVTGFDPADVVSGTPGTSSSGSNSQPVFPATTPDNDQTLVIRATGADNDEPSPTGWVPAGHTKIASGGSTQNGNDCAFAAASLDGPPAAGASTGTATYADTSINDTWGASTIAINPVPAVGGSTVTLDAVHWAQFNSSTLAIESPNPGTGACSGWCSDSAYDLPAPRRGHSMVAYNGYLYVIGGRDAAGNRVSTVYIAKIGANGEPSLWHPTDTNRNNWVYWYTDTGLSGGTAKSYTSVVASSNRMYLIGGQTNASPGGVTAVQRADIQPNGVLSSWTTSGMQALPAGAGRHMAGVQVYNNVLYTMGGFEGAASSSANLRSSVYYSKINADGSINSWQATKSLRSARASFGGSFSYIWGAYIYLGGGCEATNGSGYCTSVANDILLASINADGSLGEWDTLGGLDNTRIGYTFIGWQGGLYRLGGCITQNSTTGECTSTLADVDYGVINPAGEVSTVNITQAPGEGDCVGGTPESCDLPPAGNNAGEIGHMLSSTTIQDGYLYVIGGCTNTACSDSSGNIAYVSVDSDGTLEAPSVCSGTSYGAWCVDSTNRVNGTAGVSAAGITTFNGRIYIVGGISDSADGSRNIYYNTTNPDGSLAGAWSSNTFGSVGIPGELSYTYAYARANPAQAGTNPGNLYIFGGCASFSASAGCSSVYNTEVYKCNITTSGSINSCSTSGQLQIDTELASESNQGLGLHSGTVYANYIYLIGGYSDNVGDRDTVFYAKFDDNNNVVDVESGTANPADNDDDWIESDNTLSVGRRRGWAFGYNGHIYAVGGYDAGGSGIEGVIPFIEWSKTSVSDGSNAPFNTSSVTINQRWGLSITVSNSYAYVIGGCDDGASPSNCQTFEPSVQTFQLYNNNSGSPAEYSASANQFSTDRLGASSAVVDGKIYIAGGCVSTSVDCDDSTNNVQYATIDVYGNIGTWTNTTGSLPEERVWGKLREVGGSLYYIGGNTNACDPTGNALFERYNSSGGGTAVADIYADGNFPDNPDVTQTISGSNLSSPSGVGDAFSGRVSALLCAPQDGNYTFWIASDDSSELRISGDATDTSLTTIASVNGWTNVNEWTKFGSQQSSPVTLEAGKYYYIEGNYKEGGGGDHLEIGWTLPDATVERPISSANYSMPDEAEELSFDASAAVYYATPDGSGNITSWSTATNGLPAPRTQFGADVWNDRIYVTGGLDGSESTTNSIYISPPLSSGGNITSAWTSDADVFDVSRSGHTTIAYSNTLYTVGGYDGSNYLNDVQFAQINADGTVDEWTFSTRLPESIRQGEGFAANGYLYLIGGRTSDDVCESNTLVAPISANTTIATGNEPTGLGEWFETNQKYAGNRYGSAVVYYGGKAYVLGGACTTSGEVKATYTSPGSNSYVVPAGVTSVNVKAWGGGGGGGAGGSNSSGGNGGGGGYARVTLAVTPSESLNVYVGEGGGNGTYAGSNSGGGGGGGGHSEINRGGTNLILAAGGGGGGGGDNSSSTPGGAGGAGGGTNGIAGGDSSDSGNNNGANGGTAGSGGAGGTDGSNNGANGGFESGGAGADGDNGGDGGQNNGGVADGGDGGDGDTGGFAGGGGGGGGLYGGGGGGSSASGDAGGGGGGGGSSYATGTSILLTAGSGISPGNNGDTDRSGAGTGGTGGGTTNSGSDGNDGIVVVSYTVPPTITYTGANRVVQTSILSQPQVAIYSRLIDTDTNVFPNSWLLNGLDNSIGARWRADYRSSADASNVIFHETFDGGTDGAALWGTEDVGSNTQYAYCYQASGTGTAFREFDDSWSVSPGLSALFGASGGTGSASCQYNYDSPISTNATRFDRFYININSLAPSATSIYLLEDSTDDVAALSMRPDGKLHLVDRYTSEATVDVGVGAHRIEVGIVGGQMLVRVYSGANIHSDIVSDSAAITLDNPSAPDQYNSVDFGIKNNVNSWSIAFDEHKTSQSDWVGSAYPQWGQVTNFGDVTLGDVMSYTPLDGAGTNTNYARWYFFEISIDASRTFGYPEDVNRGPTIADLSLFFTSDPSKRLRHGKTFTGGEQQPLDTPCRQSVDADCPLP